MVSVIDLPLRWILHTSLVCKPDVSCTDLLLGDVFASTKIFIVNKMYNADEVQHRDIQMYIYRSITTSIIVVVPNPYACVIRCPTIEPSCSIGLKRGYKRRRRM